VDINSAFPSNYIKASDLDGPTRLVIAKVSLRDIRGDRKVVAEFTNGDRALIINKTNARTIARAYGSDTDRWIGKPIELVEALVDFQGNSVPAVRVRIPVKQAAKVEPSLDDEIPDEI
jgi:hypothetical protein